MTKENATERDLARTLIQHHEGLRLVPCVDSRGTHAVGWGRNLNLRPLSPEEVLRLIQSGADGHGGITVEFADYLLENDISEAQSFLSRRRGWWQTTVARRCALIDAYHNLGTGIEKFSKMWTALGVQDYGRAADEMRDSVWWRSAEPGVRRRIDDLCRIVRYGHVLDKT
jgi:GH24 family phage-related lysozyme (muramidase)